MENINLKFLNIFSDSYDYVTRLIPLGKDGLTIEEINNGKKYVENYQYSNKIIYATRVWKDLSGNGNHGELMNFSYSGDSGWTSDGLKFDGVDDYVTGTELRISHKGNALELWVYTNSDEPQVFFATNLGLGCGINVRKEITLAVPNSKCAATF